MSYHDDQPIDYIVRMDGPIRAIKTYAKPNRKDKPDKTEVYACETSGCKETIFFRGKGGRSKYCLECKYEVENNRRNKWLKQRSY